jgi:RNA polymerase sigma factor (sigma-70 family)
VAISITKNEHDAQDILQDSYIKAWEKISTLEKPEAFAGWLSQIVANQAKNYISRKRPDSFADYGDENAMYWQEETDTDLLPSENYDRAEARALIAQLITQLPEDQRLVLLMRYYDDMEVAQVAQTLELPEGTVKSRLHRARAKLAAALEQAKDKGIAFYSVAPIPLLCQVLQGLGLEDDPADRLPAIIGLATAGVAAAGATAAAAGSATACTASTATTAAVATTATTAAVGASITGIVAACAAAVIVTGGLVAGGVAVHRQQTQEPTDYVPAAIVAIVDTTVPTTTTIFVTEPTSTTTEPYVLADTVTTYHTQPTQTTSTTTTTTQATTSQTTVTTTTRRSLTIPEWWLRIASTQPMTTTSTTTTTNNTMTTSTTTRTTTTTAVSWAECTCPLCLPSDE